MSNSDRTNQNSSNFVTQDTSIENSNSSQVRRRHRKKKKDTDNNHNRNHSAEEHNLGTLQLEQNYEGTLSQPSTPTQNVLLKKTQSLLGLSQHREGGQDSNSPSPSTTPIHTPKISSQSSPFVVGELDDSSRRRTYDGVFNSGTQQSHGLDGIIYQNIDEDDSSFSFWDYFSQEVNPVRKKPERDIVWGQTERDRVYSALCKVPYQFELLMWFGMSLCNDSFLSVFSLVPFRAVKGVISLVRGKGIRGDQLFDIVCLFVLVVSSWLVMSIEARTIYYWIKDVTSEFLKLHALHNLIAIIDMVSGNFAKDTLEALSGTCTLLVMNKGGKRSKRLFQLVMDTCLVILFVTLHGTAIMAQGLLFIVTLTSRNNMLIALLIASNFYEVKGSVFKKWNEGRLEQLALIDVLERWHLGLSMLFVTVEHMKMNEALGGETGTGWRSMAQIQKDVFKIYGAEVFIDVVKHSVLAKFNNVNPGMYREYIFKICGQAEDSQSHNVHHIVGFEPFGPAVLMVRIVATYLAVGTAEQETKSMWITLVKLTFVWVVVFILKLMLGYGIKCSSKWYQQFYEANYGTKARKASSGERETQMGNVTFRMQLLGMSIVLLQLYYFFRDWD
eukprot:TRINITY_DN5699_c0_g1_i3.p1 TRINITY_DN5699_c0_g1~~TRINITY_DN5699_c0_g1_i3.p1  ORF type:complete len:642 (+),score=52.05 TRINITY_DN5699_c0_g1_i3:89-1927(+)